MFKRKNTEVIKPDKVKINLAIKRCKASIEQTLDSYEEKIQNYQEEYRDYLRNDLKDSSKAKRVLKKANMVMAQQEKMEDMLDKVEQIEFSVTQAFAKQNVYETFGTVLSEANKVTVSPEIKGILKEVKDFDNIFNKNLAKLDSLFEKVTDGIQTPNEEKEQEFISEAEKIAYEERENTFVREAEKEVEREKAYKTRG